MGCNELLVNLRANGSLVYNLNQAQTLVGYNDHFENYWRSQGWNTGERWNDSEIPLGVPSGYEDADRCFRQMIAGSSVMPNFNYVTRLAAERTDAGTRTVTMTSRRTLFTAQNAYLRILSLFRSGMQATDPRDAGSVATPPPAPVVTTTALATPNTTAAPRDAGVTRNSSVQTSSPTPAGRNPQDEWIRRYGPLAILLMMMIPSGWLLHRLLSRESDWAQREALRVSPRRLSLHRILTDYERVYRGFQVVASTAEGTPRSRMLEIFDQYFMDETRVFLENILRSDEVTLPNSTVHISGQEARAISRAELQERARTLLDLIERGEPIPSFREPLRQLMTDLYLVNQGIVTGIQALTDAVFLAFRRLQDASWRVDSATRQAVPEISTQEFLTAARQFQSAVTEQSLTYFGNSPAQNRLNALNHLKNALERSANFQNQGRRVPNFLLLEIEAHLQTVAALPRATQSASARRVMQVSHEAISALEDLRRQLGSPNDLDSTRLRAGNELLHLAEAVEEFNPSPSSHDRVRLLQESREIASYKDFLKTRDLTIQQVDALIARVDTLVSEIYFSPESRTLLMNDVSTIRNRVFLWRTTTTEALPQTQKEIARFREAFLESHRNQTRYGQLNSSRSQLASWEALLNERAQQLSEALSRIENNLKDNTPISQEQWDNVLHRCDAYRRVLNRYRTFQARDDDDPDDQDPPPPPMGAGAVDDSVEVVIDDEMYSANRGLPAGESTPLFVAWDEDEPSFPFLPGVPATWTPSFQSGVRVFFRAALRP